MSRVIAGAVLLCALCLVLWWRMGKPHIHRNLAPADVQRLLEALLRRGYDRGSLIIEVDDSQRPRKFVQFTKYIAAGGRIGLQFDFPLARWSQPYYEAIQQKLEESGLQYRVEKTGRQDTEEFINVDLATDLNRAYQAAALSLTVLSSNRPEVRLRGSFQGISAADVEIRA